MVMSIVFHLTANIKFCICLAVYEYTSNVSRSRTTLASLLGPTALQLPRGRQHWLRGLTPRLLAQLQPVRREQSLSSSSSAIDSCSS